MLTNHLLSCSVLTFLFHLVFWPSKKLPVKLTVLLICLSIVKFVWYSRCKYSVMLLTEFIKTYWSKHQWLLTFVKLYPKEVTSIYCFCFVTMILSSKKWNIISFCHSGKKYFASYKFRCLYFIVLQKMKLYSLETQYSMP